ncbi:MAG: AAA family ATPase [Lachnospiraceae bacterium]|nr:AAA family ATPase [Lachnospiraceae bacterium]
METFENVIGHESVKAELIKYADVIRNHEKYAALGVQIPSGIMLCGEPGVGKTLMAKAFCSEAGCRVFLIRKDKPDGEFVSHIKKTFDEAKDHTPSIVFLDDLDKFANEDANHKNAEEYVSVQACIDDCKGMGVLTFATVNDVNCLPDSLLRKGRFDKSIDVSAPGGKDAIRVIRYFLSRKQVEDDIDLDELALVMEEETCAELKTIINEAAIYAGFKGKDKVDHDDIIKAFLRTRYDALESSERRNPEILRKIATHEAGHAVVHEVLEPNSVTLVSVCSREYIDSGIVKAHRAEEYHQSCELLENDVITKLGGKAATEVVWGEADMGCAKDVSQAFRMVRGMVDDRCTLGFGSFEEHSSSQYLLTNKDIVVETEMERYYQKAKRIIAGYRDFLDAIVDALLDHETITYREMQKIREKFLGTEVAKK